MPLYTQKLEFVPGDNAAHNPSKSTLHSDFLGEIQG